MQYQSIIEAVENRIKYHPEKLIFAFTYNDQLIWVKRRPASKITIWHRLQYLLTRLIPLPIFKPTSSPGGSKSLREEAERLQHFSQRGIPVASVLHIDDNCLVTNDVGSQLSLVLKRCDSPVKRQSFLFAAAELLQKVHRAGLTHGRPSLRDMTVQDDKLYFIDLEENPTEVMSLAEAQARDIWLFLHSVVRYCPEESEMILQQLYDTCANRSPSDTQRALKKMVTLLKPVRIVLMTIGAIGRDVKNALRVNLALEKAVGRP